MPKIGVVYPIIHSDLRLYTTGSWYRFLVFVFTKKFNLSPDHHQKNLKKWEYFFVEIFDMQQKKCETKCCIIFALKMKKIVTENFKVN